MTMTNLIDNILNLILIPFKDNNIFVAAAGFLCITWLFRYVYRMISGNY